MAKTIYLQEPQEFNLKLAEALKEIAEFKVPDWALFVKTGVSKIRVPEDDDFWYKRAGSILRQLYLHGMVGVGRLRTRYGGKMDRGGRASKFRKASGKIIRVILQQAEAAGFVEKVTSRQFGRRLTQAGRDFLDDIKVAKKEVVETVSEKEEVVEEAEVAEEKVEEVKPEKVEDGKEKEE